MHTKTMILAGLLAASTSTAALAQATDPATTGVGTAPDAGTATGVQTPGTGVDTGVGTGADTGVGTGVDTGVGAGVDTGVGAGVDTGVGTGVDTGVGTGVDTGVGTGVDAGLGADTGVGTGMATDTATGVGTATVGDAALTGVDDNQQLITSMIAASRIETDYSARFGDLEDDADVRVVYLSDLRDEASETDAELIDQALADLEATTDDMRSAIEEHEMVMSALEDEGHSPDDVVAVVLGTGLDDYDVTLIVDAEADDNGDDNDEDDDA